MIALSIMALLNRIRGGGFYVGAYIRETLHVKPLFIVAPLVGLLAFGLGFHWFAALGWALGYLVWALPAWGRWFDLGNAPDLVGREYADPLERWIDERASDDLEALIMRHGLLGALAVCIIAGFTGNVIILAFTMILPWMIVKSYELSWRFNPDTAIRSAEVLTGISWGFFIWLASLFN